MHSIISFRLSNEQQASMDNFRSGYRKSNEENLSVSDLIRRCLEIGLRDHRSELVKGGA